MAKPLGAASLRAPEFAGYDAHRVICGAPGGAPSRGVEQAELLGELRAQLIGEHAPLHLLDRAFGQIAERERPERHADQPVDGQAEMLGDPLHLAVLAFAQRKW